MQLADLEKALRELPHDALLTEIPQVQNSIAHLYQSNEAMEDYDPQHSDPDLVQALQENKSLIERYQERIDVTLRVIQQVVGEAAAREMESNVKAFRARYGLVENGVFL
ncbi:hypothetical protein BDF14DRAFT_1721209 [Spinellus fusiger]|nr:hypothetical protein BDF14DRAFT_1721209 [Spinellus fusiger]